jgi:2-methylcitrate dehydratase PrpD
VAGVTETSTILAFANAPHRLPPQVRADAERLLADTLAVGAAGAATAETTALAGALAIPDGSEARLLRGGRAKAGDAAFVNGFAIHCLEWDAVHEPAVVHALSVVTAALLAVSDRHGGSDPDDFLNALAVGVDIASGLGIAATGPMRFFRPAMAGVIGAALAAARLDGLPPASMSDVLGLAYSFAGGTMQAHVEGSIALPLQIGRAAQAAVQAVDLVKAGLTGPHDVLEGVFGYASLIEPIKLSRYTPGEPWRISEVSIKPYPCGRASHAALHQLQLLADSWHAALSVMRVSDPQRSLGDHLLAIFSHITLAAPPLISRLVGRAYSAHMSPAYARLCLPFLGALMLRDRVIDPRQFTPATFADPLIAELAGRIHVETDDSADANALSPQRLIVETGGGGRDDILVPHTLGSPQAPMSQEQTAAKRLLAMTLADRPADRRIFDDPLCYATEPA